MYKVGCFILKILSDITWIGKSLIPHKTFLYLCWHCTIVRLKLTVVTLDYRHWTCVWSINNGGLKPVNPQS